ncbi:MAG: hypothetical protein KGZ84_05525 [Erysipelotrichia bacterium]|jgi:capsular polysaccharide biosynthesis protein|nr:hypothetical protein [Erysipelotrichia bacterium]
MQNQQYEEEISLLELLDVLRRNLKLITMLIILGLLSSIILSGISFYRNREVNSYSVETQIILSGSLNNEQGITLIVNTLSHVSSLNSALTTLKIENSNYKLTSQYDSDSGLLAYKVEGSNSETITQISTEIFKLVKPIIEGAFPSVEIREFQTSEPVLVPKINENNVNWLMNIILGIILSGMFAVFYVFAVYFMSPYIITDNDFESLFDSKVLGKFTGKTPKSKLRKLLEVR